MAAVALLLGLAINLLTAQFAAAQTPPSGDSAEQSPRGRARQAREAMRAMAAYSGAASTYTDIAELTLAERTDAVRLRIAAARGDLARLRPMLADEAFELMEKRLGDVEAAHEKGDRTGTALAALEAFKTIATSTDPRMRRMPIELSMQSYSAFKLMVLASTPQIDWPAVRLAAKEAEKSWIGVRRFIRDTNMRVLFSRMQGGLRDAVARDDAAGVKFAASLQLASAAVLQDFFARFARSMAKGRGGDVSQLQQQGR
jgi:hypothetical protein